MCAFRTMAEELTHHGADAELISDALAAADDEARHAVSVGAIAARLGAAVEPAKVEASGVRDLFAIALENATEGCVRETFGALIGHHQALAAEDPEVRRAMAEIAQDETRHAALSWRVAQWVEPKLDEHERRRIAQARDEAIHELRTELSVEPDPALARIAGLPGAREAVAMLDTLRIALWAHA